MVLILASVFHLTGIESAFCDDSNPAQAMAHGCQVCQPSHHFADAVESDAPFFLMKLTDHALADQALIQPQEPAFTFFRPPIHL